MNSIVTVIPNDVSLCAYNTVIDHNPNDVELDIPAGFAIQASATKPFSFAMPYYMDPINGFRRCRGLHEQKKFDANPQWKYDIAFVGFRGFSSDVDSYGRYQIKNKVRHEFTTSFQNYGLKALEGYRVRFHCNDRFFFADHNMPESVNPSLNLMTQYLEAIQLSKFVLCPRGGGANSVRFFEALASTNVPIYIGGEDTKLPLDWIIDWQRVCFRIPTEAIVSLQYLEMLKDILGTSREQLASMRRYIFEIYREYLSVEKRELFVTLVCQRASQLMLMQRESAVQGNTHSYTQRLALFDDSHRKEPTNLATEG